MKTIGVFDSGVGGLTVLRALHAKLPGHGTAYLGDTARVPYGNRSAETVIRYARNAARMLVAKEDLSVLVVACNTAGAVALSALAEDLAPLPVIGVIEPTAARAVALSIRGRIGIIGTQGTILSGAYQRAVKALRPEAWTTSRACPLFVPLAEEGWSDATDPIAQAVAARYLAPLVAEGIDALILGCTHYPILERVIAAAAGPNVVLAEASESVADALLALLGPGNDPLPARRYYVTDAPNGFAGVAERFLGAPLGDLREVDL